MKYWGGRGGRNEERGKGKRGGKGERRT